MSGNRCRISESLSGISGNPFLISGNLSGISGNVFLISGNGQITTVALEFRPAGKHRCQKLRQRTRRAKNWELETKKAEINFSV
jgi:hypothetical protein